MKNLNKINNLKQNKKKLEKEIRFYKENIEESKAGKKEQLNKDFVEFVDIPIINDKYLINKNKINYINKYNANKC